MGVLKAINALGASFAIALVASTASAVHDAAELPGQARVPRNPLLHR